MATQFPNGRVTSSNDHWFPHSMMKSWVDDEGRCHQIEPDGKVTTFGRKPKSVGSVYNGHLIQKDGYWAGTAEDLFAEVDRELPNTIEQIRSECRFGDSGWRELTLEPNALDKVYWLASSLAVRSPGFRGLARRTTENFGCYGASIPDNHHMISLLIADNFPRITDRFKSSLLMIILSSKDTEFIFGDGFFNNLVLPVSIYSEVSAIIPIAPELAIIFCSPHAGCRAGAYVHRVAKEAVVEVNFATQVYSEKFIYYRSEQPKLDVAFTCGERRRFASDSSNALDMIVKLHSRELWN